MIIHNLIPSFQTICLIHNLILSLFAHFPNSTIFRIFYQFRLTGVIMVAIYTK